jgi:aryl-alcohol dehydrogenase-like predicted oxidoreductase
LDRRELGVEHRSLGRSGLKVSALSLGCMTFGESQTFMKGVTSPDSEARRVLDVSLERGITLLDTANVYSEGRSEELLGEWLGQRREKVVLATKCRFPIGFGVLPLGPNDSGLSRKHVVEACEASLRRLKTDWIDLYQVHMQDRTTPVEETLRALDELVRAGKVRYAGCSNYTGYRLVESLWAADRRSTVRYESVQIQWSLLVRDVEREVVPACRAFGLGVLVWGALARGFLTGKYRRNQPPPAGSRLESWRDAYKQFDNDRSWSLLDTVKRLAERRGTSPMAVANAWLLAQPEVSSVIIGARDVRQLEDNLAGLELKLSQEELDELTKVSTPEWGYPQNFIAMREPW